MSSSYQQNPAHPPSGRLKVIFHELGQREQSGNRQGRIQLMQEAIGLVDPTADPKLWATLQFGLGNYLLEDQTDTSSTTFERAIEAYRSAISVLNPYDYPNEWLATYLNLGVAYFNRADGNREENLQHAIDTFRYALHRIPSDVLQLTQLSESRETWANLQYNLGLAHLERRTGDPDQNLVEAVSALHEAQRIFTRKYDPRTWANIQYKIGRGYTECPSIHRVSNLEEAIKAFEEALNVYTRQHFPAEWARVQRHLGYLYGHRLWLKDDPYEQAIQAYRLAQTVFTKKDYPEVWAEIQVDLAWPYRYRLKGDPADNKERALEAIQEALSVYTQQAYPEGWASAQVELGMAYIDRSYGVPLENCEHAITALQNAQTVYSRDVYPLRWAVVQGELGLAYLHASMDSDKSLYLERSLEAYKAAISVYENILPTLDWNATINLGTFQSMLGKVYSRREEGIRAENLDHAINAFQAALASITRENYPGRWADIHTMLAQAYMERIHGTPSENLQLAIQHYKTALEIHRPKSEAWASFTAVQGFARAQAELGAWDEVYAILQPALKEAEQTYTIALTEASRTETIQRNANMYQLLTTA